MGSILGDFTRGVDLSALPGEVHRGVRHHFAVDTFTDRHPEVLESKRLFSQQRRRFAGVALDILYDHFLLKHWHSFSDHDCDRFILRTYRELNANRHLMPLRMAKVTARMVDYDWFGAYQDLDNIGQAMDRVAARVRFPNRFEGMIEEIHNHSEELEQRFLRFFPELQTIAKEF